MFTEMKLKLVSRILPKGFGTDIAGCAHKVRSSNDRYVYFLNVFNLYVYSLSNVLLAPIWVLDYSTSVHRMPGRNCHIETVKIIYACSEHITFCFYQTSFSLLVCVLLSHGNC